MAKSMIMEFNLKEGTPTCNAAIADARDIIARRRQDKAAKCLLFIHGYGSHGVGGAIRVAVRNFLNLQKRKGCIKEVINGEDFNVLNGSARVPLQKYQGFEELLRCCNHGVTVVEL